MCLAPLYQYHYLLLILDSKMQSFQSSRRHVFQYGYLMQKKKTYVSFSEDNHFWFYGNHLVKVVYEAG